MRRHVESLVLLGAYRRGEPIRGVLDPLALVVLVVDRLGLAELLDQRVTAGAHPC
jgi:hypothetical protein